jgi:Periplasmic copper-binding protein (NosD)
MDARTARRRLAVCASVAAALAVIAATPGRSRAASVCVNPGGTGGCHASILAAVAAASNGDLIDIAAGTYAECLIIRGRRLTLQGAGSDVSRVVQSGSPCGHSPDLIAAFDDSKIQVNDLAFEGGGTGLACSSSRVGVARARFAANYEAGFQLGYHCRATVAESVFEGNQVGLSVGYSTPNTVIVDGSTISGNESGISFRAGRLLISRSTIHGNAGGSAFDAGGIFVFGVGSVRLTSSTVSGNDPGAFTSLPNLTSPIKKVFAKATIIADNTAGCPGVVVVRSQGNNLDDDSSCLAYTKSSDLLGVDPLLEPLADNGGPTPTQGLGAGSPAIDHVASRSICRKPDQRGVARSFPCDVGAFESP